MRVLVSVLSAAVLLIAVMAPGALALNPEPDFTKWGKVVSAETTFAHFGPHLHNDHAVIQAWNLAACFSLLPFGTRFKFLDGSFDGALEVGVKPIFERFETQNQNFRGLGLNLRYYPVPFSLRTLGPLDQRVNRPRRQRLEHSPSNRRNPADRSLHESDLGGHRSILFHH